MPKRRGSPHPAAASRRTRRKKDQARPSSIDHTFSAPPIENPTITTSGDVIMDTSTEPPVCPRTELTTHSQTLRESTGHDYVAEEPSLKMVPGRLPKTESELEQYDMNAENFAWDSQTYPSVEDIAWAGNHFFAKSHQLIKSFDPEKKITIPADEIVRFQQILDEFGHADPQLPPNAMKKHLESNLAGSVFERVLNWAIIKNLTVDGDLRHTLLPRQIVESFRDLDCESTTEHLILSRKWVRMTFGLLQGGLARSKNSDLQGLNRIRDFVVKLLGPYFLETNEDGLSFFTFVTNTLLEAMNLGYHILGHCCLYRWDWNWPSEKDDSIILIGSASKDPPTYRGPSAGLVVSPALLKISDDDGLPLSRPSTCVAAVALSLET